MLKNFQAILTVLVTLQVLYISSNDTPQTKVKNKQCMVTWNEFFCNKWTKLNIHTNRHTIHFLHHVIHIPLCFYQMQRTHNIHNDGTKYFTSGASGTEWHWFHCCIYARTYKCRLFLWFTDSRMISTNAIAIVFTML